MRPHPAFDQMRNRTPTAPMRTRQRTQFGPGSGGSADGQHLNLRKPSPTAPLPPRYQVGARALPIPVSAGDSLRILPGPAAVARRRAPFGHHVSGVVCWCAQEEMGRVDTRRGIAGVADERARRDRTNRERPSQSMRRPVRATERQRAIAGAVPVAGPQPAAVGADDLIPEAIDHGRAAGLPIARLAAVPPSTEVDSVSTDPEAPTALLAAALNREGQQPPILSAHLASLRRVATPRASCNLAPGHSCAFTVPTPRRSEVR